jgi:hypothetical protein
VRKAMIIYIHSSFGLFDFQNNIINQHQGIKNDILENTFGIDFSQMKGK